MPEVVSSDRELPHELAAAEVIARLETDAARGLSAEEAARRLAEYGPNALPTEARRPAWLRFLSHFRDAQVYLLLFATAISLLVWALEREEEWPLEAMVILAIVVLNALFGFLQEERAGQALASLRSMTPDEASVLRGGELLRIDARNLVPGDLVVVNEGDRIAADARLIEVTAFQAQEAALTGESLPVRKHAAPLAQETAAADRRNMIYSGTAAVSGHARGVVTATGSRTEFGRIAAMLRDTKDRTTPLQKELDRLGRRLGGAVILIAAIVVGTLLLLEGIHDGRLIIHALLFGIALAVAATPEGLAAVVTVVLALGVRRMARRGAIVRHLKAVETLGEATVIASDKTGTMTQNLMRVQRVATASGEAFAAVPNGSPTGWTLPDGGSLSGEVQNELRMTLSAAALANNAWLRQTGGAWEAEGDPTESALLVAAAEAGEDLEKLRRNCPRAGEIPFTSERKRMSTLHHCSGDGARLFGSSRVLLVKGAADSLLERATREMVAGRARPLTPERRQEWLRLQEDMAAQALRTLGVAMKPLPWTATIAAEDADRTEQDVTFLGIAGMFDPPRPEAREAVARARTAGVRTIMITGDHAATALAVARELNIGSGTDALTGNEISAMSDEALAGAARSATVFARVNPEHKLRLVRALQHSGEIVAMTGDGVNDAPALKAADISVAMGMTGTEVAREASDLVLTDDNFATIVAAIEEGRGIYDNIRKFLRYLLATNAGEVLTLFLGVALTVRAAAHQGELILPLLAVQILWINLVTDGAPALALGLERSKAEVMHRPPLPAGTRIIDRPMIVDIGLVAMIMAAGTLFIFHTTGGSMELRRTMAFNTLILFQLFNAFQARSSTRSVFSGLFHNRWLWGSVALMILLQVVVVDLPWVARAFSVAPLSASMWLQCGLAASSVIWGMEILKWLRRYLSARKEAVSRGGTEDQPAATR